MTRASKTAEIIMEQLRPLNDRGSLLKKPFLPVFTCLDSKLDVLGSKPWLWDRPR